MFAAMNAPLASTSRVASIDLIRGAVMVLMAIDHVRVYSGVPAGGPTPGVFFTRWVTHFCAPAFVFLAGTAAFLYGEKVKDRGALAGVIWMLGWCMILMAGLVYLPLAVVGTIGVAIIALHNVTDAYAFQLARAANTSGIGWLWQLLYFGGDIPLGGGG